MADQMSVKHIAKDPYAYRIGNKLDEKRLYKKLYSRLIGVCLRYATDQQEAWDIFNRAMCEVFKVLDRGEKIENIEAYTRVILVRKCIDFARKRTRGRFQQIEKVPGESIVINTALNRLAVEEIMSLIQELPENQRMVFNLYIIEGYNHKEISEILEIPEGTSKWYLSEAKKTLREQLKHYRKV